MSRTRVHRPKWAWFDDPSNCIEEHDHRHGPCDLPTRAEWYDWMARHWLPTPWRCGWELNLERMPRLCGCQMCTGSHWHRIDRRNDRHAARVWLHSGRWQQEWWSEEE